MAFGESIGIWAVISTNPERALIKTQKLVTITCKNRYQVLDMYDIYTMTPKIKEITSIGHLSEAEILDWCLIDEELNVLVIWVTIWAIWHKWFYAHMSIRANKIVINWLELGTGGIRSTVAACNLRHHGHGIENTAISFRFVPSL